MFFALVHLAVALQAPVSPDVLTSRNTPGRTGVSATETALTPAGVNAAAFGKLWTLYADGQIVAQPLYLSNLAVETSGNPNSPRVQGTFNAVLIGTMHNTVYLYDADHERRGPDGRTIPLWATWLGQPRPGGSDIDMWAVNDPEWGILSTPVIDPTKSIVYLVAWHDDGGPDRNYHYRLHALRLKDGTHVTPPVLVEASGLNPRSQKQRAGLLLAGGILYISFGGDGSRGLVVAYDAATLTRKATWASTPTGNDGGIWQAGQAPAADAAGNVYLMTGNGTFDAHTGGANYGESFVKLRLEGDSLVVKDYFTPCNAGFLNSLDMDLGSAGPVLVPGANLIFGGGKEGRLYLLSTARLGKHVAPLESNARTCPNPNVLEDFQAAQGHLHGSPVFWEASDGARVYVWGENDRLRAYRFANRRIVQTARLSEYRPPDGMPGGMLSLSSNGRAGGILWAVVPLNGDANKFRGVKGIVLALDALDVSKALWTSEQSGARDRLGLFARFVPPTVAGGKVFVATYGDDEPLRLYGTTVRPQTFPARYQVAVYGLLPEPAARVVNQSREDVQLVSASVGNAVRLDLSRCRPGEAQSLDCTGELGRAAGAPSLERLIVPSGYDFAGCQLLRATTAANKAALPAALGIGFYAAASTGSQLSVNLGRLVPSDSLKAVGEGILKSGQPAILHEFATVVNCTAAPGVSARKLLKPYIDFSGGTPPVTYRNWDPIAGNYTLGGDAASLERRGEVLR
ncbi:MAG: hypothetical protein ACJ8DC_09455 [Gemmatimonadales bacterium]